MFLVIAFVNSILPSNPTTAEAASQVVYAAGVALLLLAMYRLTVKKYWGFHGLTLAKKIQLIPEFVFFSLGEIVSPTVGAVICFYVGAILHAGHVNIAPDQLLDGWEMTQNQEGGFEMFVTLPSKK